MARRRSGWVAGALFFGLTATRPAAAELLDDFSGKKLDPRWHLSRGEEFAGAAGELELAQAGEERTAALRYDFRRGGAYVAAVLELPEPRAMRYLRVTARVPDDVSLGARVRDASGQWLQYRFRRPLGVLDPDAPFTTTLELADAERHWGGADDGRLHEPVAAIAVLVEATEARGEGRVYFDDLSSFNELKPRLDPRAAKMLPVPRSEAALFDGLGVALHDLEDDRALDAAKAVGLTWARVDLFWDRFEQPRGKYDFRDADRFVAALESRGMRPIFLLGLGHAAYGGGPPVDAAASAGFAAFARAAATRYAGRGFRYEIWNEPNIAKFWPPAPNAAAAARTAVVGARAVHAGDPHAEVVTGGLSWFELGFLDAFLAAGAAEDAQAVGIHPYRNEAAPESLTDELVRARRIVRRRVGRELPIWDTEWGYSSTQFGAGDGVRARERQAVLAVRRLLASRLAGFPVAVWYDLTDDGKNPGDNESNFGLLTHDGSPKPALRALATLRAKTSGHTLRGFLEIGAPVVNALVLDGPSERAVVLWSTASGGDIEVTTPAPLAAANLFGTPLPLASSYVLSEAKGPIYLTFPAPPLTAPASHSPSPSNPGARVERSSRGCGCALPGYGALTPSAWQLTLFALSVARARRRGRARTSARR